MFINNKTAEKPVSLCDFDECKHEKIKVNDKYCAQWLISNRKNFTFIKHYVRGAILPWNVHEITWMD